MRPGDTTESTLPEIVANAAAGGQHRILRLTLLYHPDSARIGEVSDLPPLAGGRSVKLGRQDMTFSSPRTASQARSLQDPYLSRTPLVFGMGAAGLSVTVPDRCSSVSIDGESVKGERCLATRELEAGLVLLLAGRIVVFLQYVDAKSWPSDDCGLVGECDALQRVREQVEAVAASDSPVLLLGESGTGKELVAQAIYARSRRADAQMVTLNMGAIPPELSATELFGMRKGAFTGATLDKPGYFRAADGGTLFLDEIGATAESVQVQLLRALQSGEIQAPGGPVERVDVRVISATDALLSDGGGFNRALRHRLAAFEINLPPLRKRREDIGRLLQHFLADFLQLPQFDEPVLRGQWALLVCGFANYHWPGNVRELQNYCQQIRLSSEGRAGLRIPGNILEALQNQHLPEHGSPGSRRHSAVELDGERVLAVMKQSGYQISGAARELGVSRQSLYRRVKTMDELRLVREIPTAEVMAVYESCAGNPALAAAQLRVSRAALLDRWRALELKPKPKPKPRDGG